MNGDTWIFLALCGGLLAFLLAASFLSKNYSLNNIKSKTVGDGQHGTARWATPKEIGKTYHTVPFRPRRWRKGKELPTEQGLILGSVGGGKRKSKAGILLKISRKLLEKLRRPVAGKQKRKLKDQKREDTLCGDCILNQSSGTQRTTLNLYQMRFVSSCLKASPYQHPMALNRVSRKNGMFQRTEKHIHSI